MGLALLVGSQFRVECATPFTLAALACNLNGYGNLCQFITRLRRASEKGAYRLRLEDIDGDDLQDCVAIVAPDRGLTLQQLEVLARWLLR